MTDRERTVGKLILLQRVREEREREALAAAAGAEDEARSRETGDEERGRAAAEAVLRAAGEEVGEAPPAQVLQYRGRFFRYLARLAEQLEVQLAASRNERITAAEAAARVRARHAQARRAREQLEERLAQARQERRRARERAEELDQDDAPPPAR